MGEDLDLIRAQGLALALIATLLERCGTVEAGEFGRLLGLLAVVTSEEEPRQGEILALWAGMIRDVPAASAV